MLLLYSLTIRDQQHVLVKFASTLTGYYRVASCCSIRLHRRRLSTNNKGSPREYIRTLA